MAGSATTALNYALKYEGTKEHPAGSNGDDGGMIDKWEHDVGMARGPWCGAFAYAGLKAAGVQGLSHRMTYVPWIAEDARANRNGLSVVSWANKRPGDLLLYQWDTGALDHVGFLISTVNATTVRTIEGNTAVGNDSNGGEVMQRVRNKANIALVVRPKYPSGAGVPLTPCEWPGITLKRGVKGASVKVVQGWINTLDDAGYKYDRLTIDGDFGPATEEQVKLYQGRHKLVKDGVVGPATWRALCSSVRAAK